MTTSSTSAEANTTTDVSKVYVRLFGGIILRHLQIASASALEFPVKVEPKLPLTVY